MDLPRSKQEANACSDVCAQSSVRVGVPYRSSMPLCIYCTYGAGSPQSYCIEHTLHLRRDTTLGQPLKQREIGGGGFAWIKLLDFLLVLPPT
jgi:hypothetical protein